MCDENDILNDFTNGSSSFDDTLDSNKSGIKNSEAFYGIFINTIRHIERKRKMSIGIGS